jgi:spermidine synthase
MIVAYVTALPSAAVEQTRKLLTASSHSADLWWILGIPLAIGIALYAITRVRCGWAFVLAVVGIGLALSTRVPQQLYMLGRHYAHYPALREFAEILLFEEGTMEPVVVFHSTDGSMQVSINSKICATSQPQDMKTQRLLAHLPVLLSQDPAHSVVVGLGAGVTAGAVAIHPAVREVDVIELEPKVLLAAEVFAAFNDNVLENPKVRIRINDGRHFISTSRQRFGVITSDPVDPWMAGAAALYTVEYFELCRDHLVEGGVFTQWLGMYELNVDGMRSILAAFATAFPDGGFWITPRDVLLVGSNRPIRIDVIRLRERLRAEPVVRESLSYVGIHSVEQLLGCYLCSCASMKGFLADAPVNHDANLYVQFSGGFSYYEWNHPELRGVLADQRAFDPDLFVVPPADADRFRASLEREWAGYAAMREEEDAAFRRQRAAIQRGR